MKLRNIIKVSVPQHAPRSSHPVRNLLTLIVIVISFSQGFSQTDTIPQKQRNWTLNGYVKYMQILSFKEIDKKWTSDNLIHNRLIFNWSINNNLSFKTHIRNRIFYGETVSTFPQYSDLINVENGFLDMSDIVFEGESVFMHSAIDRLYFDYNYNNWQITIGRQRINWGQTFVWNPNDLFNSSSFFDFDYEEKPGSDAVRLQYYPTYSSRIDLVAKLDNNEKLTLAGLYQFNKWNTDIQIIGGYYTETDYVIGSGFSGNILKGAIRGELNYFHPKYNISDTSGTFVASLGYDYTFENSLMVQVEALYNGYGNKSGNFDLSQFYFMQLSPKNLTLTEFSYLVNLTYPISPLLNGTFSAMYNPNNNSAYFGPSLSYSLKENLDLSIFSQYFTSDTPIAQGGKGGFLFWRLKWSF